MKTSEIIKALRRMGVLTGGLMCVGCGHEHNCGIHGCAVIRKAADTIEELDNFTDSQCARLLEKLQKAEAAIPRWISVEERMPDKPGHYLVLTSINYWHGGCMDVNMEHRFGQSGTPKGYDGTTMSAIDCYYDITGSWNRVFGGHVTHWMPLPEPPEEETT